MLEPVTERARGGLDGPVARAAAQAQDAYERGLAGSDGGPELAAALSALAALEGGAREHARALALSGLLARGRGELQAAAATLLDAAGRLAREDERPSAELCFALGVEALCATGELESAAAQLSQWAAQPELSTLTSLAAAALQLARGELESAAQLAARLAHEAPLQSARRWARLFAAEAQLDLQRPQAAALTLSEAVADSSPGAAGALDEAQLHARVLRARAAVEALWGSPSPEGPALQEATAAVAHALASAARSPRARGWLLALQSDLEALAGRPGEPGHEAACALLAGCGARLEVARLWGRRAAFQAARDEAARRALVAQAAQRLAECGAKARAGGLAWLSDAAGERARLQGALETGRAEIQGTQRRLAEAQREAAQQEMELARRIQQTVVPARTVVRRPGLNLAGWVDPATRVGGDFWTFLELPEDRTLLLIGDVTGHGVDAGMLTTMARACVATLLRRTGELRVAELLQTLSDVVYDSARGELTMSAFACLVDPVAKTLTFANAGHNHPYFVEAGGGMLRAGMLISRGNLIGDADGNSYDVKTREYAAGDRLVLYTDGLVECANAQRQPFGERRFRQLLVAFAKHPIDEQLRRILDEAYLFFGAQPRDDDLTLVLAELT